MKVAELGRLRRAGIAAPDVVHTERALDDTDAAQPRVRFTLLTPPDVPEGRVLLIRHRTPEVLWQERFLQHPNNAVALAEVILAVEDAAASAARFALLAGRPLLPDPLGGYALDLPRGRVCVCCRLTRCMLYCRKPAPPCCHPSSGSRCIPAMPTPQ